MGMTYMQRLVGVSEWIGEVNGRVELKLTCSFHATWPVHSQQRDLANFLWMRFGVF